MMQKNEYRIRRAGACDAGAVAEIERECFSAPWSAEAVCDTMGQAGAAFFIAEDASGACGYVGSYSVLDEGNITNVAVKEGYRRRGIAQALLSALIDDARARGLSFLTLEVRAGNSAAISLYKKLGFSAAGMRRGYYSEPEEDAKLMTLFLKG